MGMVSQSVADGGKAKSSKDGGTTTKLYAKFATVAPGVTLPDEFKPRVKYEKKLNSKGTEEGIEAKVLFALPADTLLDPLVDGTGFLVRILTGSTEKGSCVLLPKAIELEYQSNVLTEFDVRYAAKVQEKTPLTGPPSTIKTRVGDCWVAALAPAVAGRGVPDVLLGDIAEISSLPALPAFPLIGPPTPGTLLVSGVFQTVTDHGDDEDDDD
jgi:hypothetical protein